MKDSKEALERLFGSYVSSNCYGINYKQDDEDYNTIKQDLDKLEKLEDELDSLRYEHNSELGKNINLQEENIKLKEVIEILVDNLQLVLKQDIDPLLNRKVYIVELKEYYKKYTGFELIQEQYELIKEVLGDDK